jgi:hypothetical protein
LRYCRDNDMSCHANQGKTLLKMTQLRVIRQNIACFRRICRGRPPNFENAAIFAA